MALPQGVVLDKHFFMDPKKSKLSRREILKSAVIGSALLSPFISLPAFADSTVPVPGIGQDRDHHPDAAGSGNSDFPSFKYKFSKEKLIIGLRK
jgi:hypothetical protein